MCVNVIQVLIFLSGTGGSVGSAQISKQQSITMPSLLTSGERCLSIAQQSSTTAELVWNLDAAGEYQSVQHQRGGCLLVLFSPHMSRLSDFSDDGRCLVVWRAGSETDEAHQSSGGPFFKAQEDPFSRGAPKFRGERDGNQTKVRETKNVKPKLAPILYEFGLSVPGVHFGEESESSASLRVAEGCSETFWMNGLRGCTRTPAPTHFPLCTWLRPVCSRRVPGDAVTLPMYTWKVYWFGINAVSSKSFFIVKPVPPVMCFLMFLFTCSRQRNTFLFGKNLWD